MKAFWLAFMLLCLASRTLTTIHYFEDPDSLRFALAAQDFDLSKMQPHFPGYPVFCFMMKIFYFITGSFSYSFSIIGGLATFFLCYYSYKIVELAHFKNGKYFLVFFLFFNPLLWIMSNRYMPDLTGLSLAIFCLYHFFKREGNSEIFFSFVMALLAGTRLSYIPLLIIPAIILFKDSRKKIKFISTGFIGIMIWLVPMIIDTGWSELITIATKHTDGHFNTWGGTIISDNSIPVRFISFVKSIFADGLGGFWFERSIITIPVTLLILISIFLVIKFSTQSSIIGKYLFIVMGIYSLWIFFGQNIIYNNRHILPLIPFIGGIMALGIENISRVKIFVLQLGFYALLIFIPVVGIRLGVQHMEPTAIAHVGNFIREDSSINKTIVSTELINQYLNGSGIRANYINRLQEDTTSINPSEYAANSSLYIVGEVPISGKEPTEIIEFYHNPYINPAWPEMTLYIFDYEKK